VCFSVFSSQPVPKKMGLGLTALTHNSLVLIFFQTTSVLAPPCLSLICAWINHFLQVCDGWISLVMQKLQFVVYL